ncbi:MAG: LytR C-terminal domain-containing protein [Elusimicrobiota bacterium]|nr:LytR C-terminal domain-containing protein [Elusimicrobiota bacterium]
MKIKTIIKSLKLKTLNIAVISAFVLLSIVFIYALAANNLAKDLLSKKPIVFSILIYGNKTVFPNKLDAFIVYYERQTNILKILSINTDAVVLKKKVKARSFKEAFFVSMKKSKENAFKTYYEDLDDVFDGKIKADYYFHADYETISKMLANNKNFKNLLSSGTFASAMEENINQLKLSQNILNNLKNKSLNSISKIFSAYSSFDTNISRFSFINLIIRFKLEDISTIFFIMPLKQMSNRLEPPKQDIAKFIQDVFFAPTDFKLKDKDGFIYIENASQKQKAAYNAALFLRDNGFDVLDWATSSSDYAETIIKAYKGNFAFALALKEVLKCGQIIVSYNSQTYYNAAIIIGKDYEQK